MPKRKQVRFIKRDAPLRATEIPPAPPVEKPAEPYKTPDKFLTPYDKIKRRWNGDHP